MKKKLSVGFFTAALAAFILLAGAYRFTYEKALERAGDASLAARTEADAAEAFAIREEGNNEFARISRHFNRMMQRLRHSREQEKEAMIREKNAEIKSLEAQINPHFLYNTLDTINWMALDREEYTISKMLTSLASILRYSIHRSNTIVEIEEELEYLKKYIYLQQQRFDYSFLCTVEADENVRGCMIHKMLIQPFLENTLVHGFPGNSQMDEVNVRFQKDSQDRIRIEIRDNGKGMPPEQVEYFKGEDKLIEAQRIAVPGIALFSEDRGEAGPSPGDGDFERPVNKGRNVDIFHGQSRTVADEKRGIPEIRFHRGGEVKGHITGTHGPVFLDRARHRSRKGQEQGCTGLSSEGNHISCIIGSPSVQSVTTSVGMTSLNSISSYGESGLPPTLCSTRDTS